MTETLIINFAKGQWYPRGQARLRRSLSDVGYAGDTWMVGDEADIPSPSHQDSPYAFKPAMFAKARERGYRFVLWCDAAVWACKPIDPVWAWIQSHGHLFFYNGWIGEWSSDAALESFGVSREEALKLHELMGCCLGLDLAQPKSQEFLARWVEKSLDGKTFPGSWTNAQGQVSADPRVKGHRHDQTAASLIAHQLGMEKVVSHEAQHAGGEGLFQYADNPAHKAFVYGKDNDMSLIRSGVCLLNQGM